MSEAATEAKIDWEDVYVKLYAFTDYLLRSKKWFRGQKTETYLKGQEVHDYVSEGISRFLEHPEKYDPTKRSLTGYLKLHIVRTLIGNDARSPENKLTKDVFAFADNVTGEGEDTNLFLDTILPYVEAFYDQEIDYNEIMNHIESQVKSDSIIENIFLGACCGMKRRDVIKEFRMSEPEYDNGMRRLKTILNNAVLKYDIKSPSV